MSIAEEQDPTDPAPDGPGRIRPIVTVGDEVLARPCRPVTEFDDDLRRLVDDMFATMYDAPGVGLAANQVGVDLRVFVIDCPDDELGSLVGHVVNPVLETPSENRELEIDEEGCLSVPGPSTDVPRAAHAVVTGVDVHGAPVRLEGNGRAARCLQHETDHLDGYLYLDRLPRKQRKRVLKAYEAGVDDFVD
jgi:peptide deformylase